MSIYAAMFSGVSGIAAQSQAMGMIADNISNVNTTGYKSTHSRFSTLVTDSATDTSYSPGGVRSLPHSLVDKQGLLQSSASETDLAIAGDGFFVVNTKLNSNSVEANYLWTRAGSFTPDANGNLRNAAGHYLQAWKIDPSGSIPANRTDLSALETVNITGLTGNAEPTTAIDLKINLSFDQTVFAGAYAAGDMTSGATTPHFERSFQIFDSVGAAHTLTFGFLKTATNTWTAEIYADLNGDGNNQTISSQLLSFNADGSLNGAGTTLSPTIAIPWDAALGITSPQNIAFSYGTDAQTDGFTQFAGASELISTDVNGAIFGAFDKVYINKDGTVTATFTNGTSTDIYKIPIATFPNPNGMANRDGNAYDETPDSGEFTLREAGSGSAGKIVSSSLESSTVDLAAEFSHMIITQRAFSAAGKVITTSDEMLDELVRLKR